MIAGALSFSALLTGEIVLPVILIATFGVVLLTLLRRHGRVALAILFASRRKLLLMSDHLVGAGAARILVNAGFRLFHGLFAVPLSALLVFLGQQFGFLMHGKSSRMLRGALINVDRSSFDGSRRGFSWVMKLSAKEFIRSSE